jgi:hypothetical protein
MAKLILRVALFLTFSTSTALARTPIETFIYHAKEGHELVPVTNIWVPNNDYDQTTLLKSISKVQPLTIDFGQVAEFMKAKNFAISLTIPGIGGGSYTFELARYDFFENGFKVQVNGNQQSFFNYTPGLYYRGVVKGIPGSLAMFSFFDNEVYGVFSVPDQGNFAILADQVPGSTYTGNIHYILYNDRDLTVLDKAPKCYTDELPGSGGFNLKNGRTTNFINNKVYNTCGNVKVYERADYSMFQSLGSNITSLTNYITALFNSQSVIYMNEGIRISLKYLVEDSVTDAFQSQPNNSSSWLTKFGQVTKDTVTGAYGSSCGILLATKYGSMGGVAWLGTLCSGYNSSNASGPYAFCNVNNSSLPSSALTYSWNVNCTCHEMGHTLSSPHTHACLWNPPYTGTTAIDGCYTLEGSCATPSPTLPSGGGTMMSYCHLTSDGVNFTKGFGAQPGQVIRDMVANSGCATFTVPTPAMIRPNKALFATRECTDPGSGTTYYWNDNNTADMTDDTLVLLMNKNGNNIGTLDSSGFTVKTITLNGYGSGTGDTMTLPNGIPGIRSKNIAMRRYWQIIPTTEPTTAVDIMFPFTLTDTFDVHGSVSGPLKLSDLLIYKVNNTINPNPSLAFPGATASDFNIYTNGTISSTTSWRFLSLSGTDFIQFSTTKLKGGGTAFYSYGTLSIENANGINAGIAIYPNPANNQLYINISNAEDNTLELYSADGKMVTQQKLQNGMNILQVTHLATGMYFYRIMNSKEVYTGKLQKN